MPEPESQFYARSTSPTTQGYDNVGIEIKTREALVPRRRIRKLESLLEHVPASDPFSSAYLAGKMFCSSRFIPASNPREPDLIIDSASHSSPDWYLEGRTAFEIGGDIRNVAVVYLASPSFQEEDRWACLKILEKLPTAALPETIETLTELQEHYHALENPSIKRPTPPARHNVRARVLDTTG